MCEDNNKLVLVTQRVDHLIDRDEVRDALDERVIIWLTAAGFQPVSVPNSLVNTGSNDDTALKKWLSIFKASGVILSGGNDIGEFVNRDLTEQCLLDWAFQLKLPVLGFCRGMQMMAHWSGAKLVETKGHVRTRHTLHLHDNKAMWPETVNSYHNWTLDMCPNGFTVMATALEDGTIEAIRHKQLPWEGWMWHPEREYPFNQADLFRIKQLFDVS